MRKIVSAIFMLMLAVQPASAQPKQRAVFNFDHDWELYALNRKDSAKQNTGIRTGSSFKAQFNDEHIAGRNQAADSIINNEQNEAMEGFAREYPGIQNAQWKKVSLPCPVRYEQPLNPGPNQFAGICYYRKQFSIPKGYAGSQLNIEFDGAMQTASVWINGKFILQHRGGYLPFSVPLNKFVNLNTTNEIVVRLDNRDDKNTPPGKPLTKLGFLYWSGIYRDARLTATSPVYITNPSQAGTIAGGGVFVRYQNVTPVTAEVLIKTQVKNALSANVNDIVIKQIITDSEGNLVKQLDESKAAINAGSVMNIEQRITIQQPHLWSPDSPYLYHISTEVWKNNLLTDQFSQPVGIRTLSFTRQEGFKINGNPFRITGTNRHQDYPFIGNALSHAAQYRDLKRIKDAGINFIRLSHYPQDPSVYDICDSLGLLVGNPIPGWQFFNNNTVFTERMYRDIREMIRRDRNHPSIIMWEVSLNESYPPDSIRIKSAAVAHQEYPGDQCFTSGDTYDAKQTNWDVPYSGWIDPPFGRPQDVQPQSPAFAREYGDYEFGGANSTTRVNASDGEQKLLQNAWNFQWEHNILRSPEYYPWTIGDANWAFFDDVEAFTAGTSDWGIMDIYRLPKFSYYFYKSQVSAVPNTGKPPMVYIANWWTKRDTAGKVIVYSNCDEIALFINGKLVKKQQPDSGPDSPYGDWEKGGNAFDGGNGKYLTHPPFTFTNVQWQAGTLKAEGFIGNKKVAADSVQTPLDAYQLTLSVDTMGMPSIADNADAVFVRANITDKNGTVLRLNNSTEITFSTEGNGEIVSPAKVKTRGGTASVLVKAGKLPGNIKITASATHILQGSIIFRSVAPGK